MKRELKIFFTAIMFYTRIPCPSWVDHDPKYINLSLRYFPFVGWIIGGISFLVYLLGSWLVNDLFGVIFSMAASVFMTGAFHEDGFADVCDGFGGGWTKDKILLIMKDSRIGAFGAIGLILLFGMKGVLLLDVVHKFQLLNVGLIYISAHAISRLAASFLVFTLDYVRDSESSKAKPVAIQVGWSNFWIGALFGILPFFMFILSVSSTWYFIALLSLLFCVYLLKKYYYKWIGGYTGDCLGAAQQVSELVFLLSVIVVWKFT